GDALISELAFSILRAIAAGRLAGHAAEGSSIRQVLYRLSVEIHRDWLMTPREELNGGKPRDLLHGAHRWSDSVVHGQQVRADSGFPVVAAPKDGRRYANAPMGREEMIVYFDLCRELLDAGWEWSLSEEITEAQIAAPQEIAAIRSRLNRFLAARRDDWLESPFEGGSAPRFIIECSRRRVPRAMGVDIVGMDERETDDHLANCDCPICDMMASGFGGLTFVQLDGHHLDLDEEFAFSVHQHFDDWQEEMREFACFNERMDQQRELPSADDLLGELRKVEFTSSDSDDARIWDSPMSDSPLSGDFQGHFKLAFRLAEIVSVLAERGAPRNLIRNLNAMFREYREGDSVLQPAARRRLFEHLEIVAERYPETLSRVSDFQSLVDETEREVTSSGDDFLNP
ncbi:MAG: hypothetical protein KDA85_08420, partial [Planctomycetaceae bacterium]|nr:hypothetical protein [Planctomycetaceae bacterium]